jgi:dihydroxyacid dehydratase/phosphogluconate dehydratase
MKKTPEQLRSFRWFGRDDLRSFGHRSRAKQMGYAAEDFQGKPVIGIINTWSDLATCHSHFRERVEEVKRGIWQEGGFPVELPAMAITETYMKPSPMMYRNFLAMETEELLRSQPIDGVVLMGGCDKTTPGLLMGAISVNLPAIYLPAGPMLRGNWNGMVLGSGSDVWKFWAEKRAGNISDCEWSEMEDGIARSPGHCMTMGTASTMTAIAETLGLSLPGASSIPAVDANHARMASSCGRRIVNMVWEDLKPSDILTEASFENAITADMAIGGSTNAIIHITALAGRAGLKLPLKKFDDISSHTPITLGD